MSFGIRDNSFMLLEDYIYIYIYNFLHGCWKYCMMKSDIVVMMLFKYVKLNFKVIVSMEFSFDINLCLSCSYDGCLFMKNHWKLLKKNSWKFKFHKIQLIEFRTLRRWKLESGNLGDKPSSRFWNPNRTVWSNPVNREPFTKTVLLTPKTVLC